MSRTRDEIIKERQRLREVYGPLFQDVVDLLFRQDPMHINYESNNDEYEPEAETILPRLHGCASTEDVRRIVHEEFGNWFGAEDVGLEENYTMIGNEIWNLWQKYNVAK